MKTAEALASVGLISKRSSNVIGVVTMSRGEFAMLQKIKHETEIETLRKIGLDKCVCKNTQGEWYVLYMKTNEICRIKFKS